MHVMSLFVASRARDQVTSNGLVYFFPQPHPRNAQSANLIKLSSTTDEDLLDAAREVMETHPELKTVYYIQLRSNEKELEGFGANFPIPAGNSSLLVH